MGIFNGPGVLSAWPKRHRGGAPVVPVPANTAVPQISGAAQEGQTLTATLGAWTNGPSSFAFQWEADGSAVGSDQNTYVPVAGDIGKMLTVTVTATNAGGSASATSNGTGPISAGGAAMPTGAIGEWYADQAVSSPRKAIPNAKTTEPVSANLVEFPRGAFIDGSNASAALTEDVTGPDGTPGATAIDGSGFWYVRRPVFFPAAGSYTMSVDVVRDAGSDQTFCFLHSSSLSPAKPAGAVWGPQSWTFTVGAAGVYNCGLWNDNIVSAKLKVDNFRVHPGSSDLGPNPVVGHLYLGTQAGNAPPITNNFLDLDMAGGVAGKGTLAFPSNLASFTDFTAFFAVAKSPGGGYTANQAILGSAHGLEPIFFVEPLAYRSAGSSAINVSGGLHGYPGEPFSVFAFRITGGTTLDFFHDGLFLSSTTITGSTQKLLHMLLGDYGGFNAKLRLHAMAFYKSALSAANIEAAYQAIKARALALSTPVDFAAARRVVYQEGDSITYGSFVDIGYAQTFGRSSSPKTYGTNRAVAGSHLDVPTSVSDRMAAADAWLPAVKEPGFTAIFTLLIGANDLEAEADMSGYATRLGNLLQARKTAGFTKVVATTVLPKTNSTFNTRRAALNAILRSSAWQTTYGIDGLVDFAADATMGTDAAAANTTFYLDGVHPTQAGHDLLAPIYGAVVDAI